MNMSEVKDRIAEIYQEIIDAEKRIRPYVHHTPIFTSETVNKMVGKEVYFKCENLQKTGSFKARGAFNSVLRAKELQPDLEGVVARSSGNHGQGIAYATKTLGLKSVIVCKEGTPAVKCQAMEGYGAEVLQVKPIPANLIAAAERIQEERGYMYICPFASNDVLAGQGTVGLELVSQIPDLDAIVLPICGGSLATGVSVVASHLSPSTKVYAAEPLGKGLEKCLRTGEITWPNPPNYIPTIAEAIQLQYLAPQNFPILQECLQKEVFAVNDQELMKAMQLVWQRMKLVVEPSAVAPLAAVLSERFRSLGKDVHKVAVVLSGGNVDLHNLPWIK